MTDTAISEVLIYWRSMSEWLLTSLIDASLSQLASILIALAMRCWLLGLPIRQSLSNSTSSHPWRHNDVVMGLTNWTGRTELSGVRCERGIRLSAAGQWQWKATRSMKSTKPNWLRRSVSIFSGTRDSPFSACQSLAVSLLLLLRPVHGRPTDDASIHRHNSWAYDARSKYLQAVAF